MKNDPVEAALERLSAVSPETPEGLKVFTAAFRSKSSRVVAKAAKLADNLRATGLCPPMADALDRLLSRADGSDKGCTAMLALTLALVSLDHDNGDLYLRGMKYVQKEASWGPPVDTAVEVRATCATGLANSFYASRLKPLIELLVDPEWGARAGAVRALAAIGSEPALLLLHYKARIGDDHPEVLSQCLEALLNTEGAAVLELVTTIATSGWEESQEAAILALGASRRSDAVAWLIERVKGTVHERGRPCLLLALSSARTEAALEFLLGLVRTASSSLFAQVSEALSIHRRDVQLNELIEAAVRERNLKLGLG
jgi:HEAT repeat protein